ncbi:MAG: hypothetical protein RL095_3253 [Verrucomicrobiota bacterium]
MKCNIFLAFGLLFNPAWLHAKTQDATVVTVPNEPSKAAKAIEKPTAEAMRALAKSICDGDKKAFDILCATHEDLYRDPANNINTNFLLVSEAFDLLGKECAKGNVFAFDALKAGATKKGVFSFAMVGLGIAATAGHKKSLDILINEKDVGNLIEPASANIQPAVDFLIHLLMTHDDILVRYAAATGLKGAAQKGNAQAKAALDEHFRSRPNDPKLEDEAADTGERPSVDQALGTPTSNEMRLLAKSNNGDKNEVPKLAAVGNKEGPGKAFFNRMTALAQAGEEAKLRNCIGGAMKILMSAEVNPSLCQKFQVPANYVSEKAGEGVDAGLLLVEFKDPLGGAVTFFLRKGAGGGLQIVDVSDGRHRLGADLLKGIEKIVKKKFDDERLRLRADAIQGSLGQYPETYRSGPEDSQEVPMHEIMERHSRGEAIGELMARGYLGKAVGPIRYAGALPLDAKAEILFAAENLVDGGYYCLSAGGEFLRLDEAAFRKLSEREGFGRAKKHLAIAPEILAKVESLCTGLAGAPKQRIEARKALLALGAAGVPALRQQLRNPDPEVAAAVGEIINEITR